MNTLKKLAPLLKSKRFIGAVLLLVAGSAVALIPTSEDVVEESFDETSQD